MITPVTLTLLAPLTVTPPVKVAAVPVMMLSVDATPVNPAPSPVNAVATTTPSTSSLTVGTVLPIPTRSLALSAVKTF